MARTETKQLQQYVDRIYGRGFYRVEYRAFKGFDAVCISPDAPPHVQHLGLTANHAHAKLDELAALKTSRDKAEKAAGF